MNRTPRPFPDVTKLPSYHYLSVDNTPLDKIEPDDFQPRAQIRKLFAGKNIKCRDNETIEEFAEK